MPPVQSLKRRPEFLALNGGLRAAKPAFVLLGRAREKTGAVNVPPETVRFGLTVTKKIGNAVIRNRARRRLRALARSGLAAKGLAGWDYVLIAREAAVARDFAAMAGELESALEMLHKARRSAGAAPDARRGGP